MSLKVKNYRNFSRTLGSYFHYHIDFPKIIIAKILRASKIQQDNVVHLTNAETCVRRRILESLNFAIQPQTFPKLLNTAAISKPMRSLQCSESEYLPVSVARLPSGGTRSRPQFQNSLSKFQGYIQVSTSKYCSIF